MRPIAVALGLFLLLTACTTPSTEGDALFQALGGRAGIERVTDQFLYQLSNNKRALSLFAHTDIGRFRTQFTNQLCSVAGGPCQYEGDSMAATHRGMNIDRAMFNSVVDDLIAAMTAVDVSVPTQNALLARLVPMYQDIVHR